MSTLHHNCCLCLWGANLFRLNTADELSMLIKILLREYSKFLIKMRCFLFVCSFVLFSTFQFMTSFQHSVLSICYPLFLWCIIRYYMSETFLKLWSTPFGEIFRFIQLLDFLTSLLQLRSYNTTQPGCIFGIYMTSKDNNNNTYNNNNYLSWSNFCSKKMFPSSSSDSPLPHRI